MLTIRGCGGARKVGEAQLSKMRRSRMEGPKMDVDCRTSMALVQTQDHPRSPFECVGQATEKEAAITVDEAERTPERLIVREPGMWFNTLSHGQTRREYLAVEPVFSQGEAANAVFYIQSGKVQLTARSGDGVQVVISSVPEGCFLGESCLADQSVRSITASALVRSTIVRIEKQVMMEQFRSDPEFAVQFLTSMVFRSIGMEEELVSQLLDSGEA